MTLRIPKVRQGSHFPALVEARRRTEKALSRGSSRARSALRLIGTVLEEQGGQWLTVGWYFSLGSRAALYGSSPAELEVLALEVPKEVIAVWLVTTDEEPHVQRLPGRNPRNARNFRPSPRPCLRSLG